MGSQCGEMVGENGVLNLEGVRGGDCAGQYDGGSGNRGLWVGG